MVRWKGLLLTKSYLTFKMNLAFSLIAFALLITPSIAQSATCQLLENPDVNSVVVIRPKEASLEDTISEPSIPYHPVIKELILEVTNRKGIIKLKLKKLTVKDEQDGNITPLVIAQFGRRKAKRVSLARIKNLPSSLKGTAATIYKNNKRRPVTVTIVAIDSDGNTLKYTKEIVINAGGSVGA